MSETVQVRERGVVTLPASVRKRHGIDVGDTFALVDFDGILVLAPRSPLVPELAREIERLREEAGVTTEELLQGLREQRARYVAERYGDEPGAENDAS